VKRSIFKGFKAIFLKMGKKCYHSDPEILGGTLVFKGTRVPVQSLFAHLKAGDSINVFLDGFPSVKRSQVLAVLNEMSTSLAQA
jgi:uncharacterized protein (DUF433 family)